MRTLLDTRYVIYSLLIFLVEVFIAVYVNDTIIRPYIGDYLVVILLYCMARSVSNTGALPVALSVLLFSYAIETLQYFKIVEILGLESYPLARVIIGTSFAWIDILAYTLGILTVLIAEIKIFK